MTLFDKDKLRDVEIIGTAITGIIRALSSQALCEIFLEKYNLKDPKPDKYYPVTSYLGLMHEVNQRMPTVLGRIGVEITKDIVFPPEMTFEQFLSAQDHFYQSGHRGHSPGDIGKYLVEKKSNVEYAVIDSTPYPCTSYLGMLKGYAQKFRLDMTIEHVKTACKLRGDTACVYQLIIRK
jgi:hypothetical protein